MNNPPVSVQTVLFADISGSTRLYERLGDERAFAAIHRCLERLRAITLASRGRVVKTIGDEIMALFPDSLSAVQAACDMQQAIFDQNETDDRLAIRIGFHAGSLLHKADGDVFGDTVNLAARLAQLANAGQILTSAATVSELPSLARAATRFLDALSVKGKADEILVYEVQWQETEEATMMVGRTLPAMKPLAELILTHHGRVLRVSSHSRRITVGRDEAADLLVEDKRASRMHAVIEQRRDKFVFIDQSSNGSYVTIQGEKEILLRREEFVLRGSGRISLGHSFSKDPSEVIEFECR